jgi:hypothetical protein
MALAWLIAAASIGFALRDYWLPKPAAPLQVGLYDLDGQLTIGWDRSAAALRGAQGGVLEIMDGDRTITMELTPELIQKGTAIFHRRSGEVMVTLRVRLPDGKTREGVAKFVGQPVAASTPAGAPQADTEAEIARLKAELEAQTRRVQELERVNARLTRQAPRKNGR